ncbi:mitogen-activated protein kinase kinase kinase NPK1 [Elaeis guineensis]|uniref:mitogen-activated protein kinase kinase kinase n=1 Tax=Elaeis guineensis var. tenera TaxID=51953 RepID=A0A6I9RM23_ELAGV|nr:mitogen-activated protein kinase kinase kinase NPK1 [Elaeis guineensis]XP_019708059.1 mitogen-activated protein kinase kinase kinase NPK1 [Elaeis guineensis]
MTAGADEPYREEQEGGAMAMQEIFQSVRSSLVFRPNTNGDDGGGGVGGIAGKIGFCLRKSRGLGFGPGFLHKAPPLPPGPPIVAEDSSPPIRWRKGELIGYGAFGQVYMGMNLDSGELLAVKQVLIGNNGASRAKAQAHIRELEEEVKLLKKLSHPNIVRYLGTVREEETLNILLEFVSGGSISSLLGKFGSFPEAVIRMYTKQLLQGLEYLHRNGIIHRDIKGANILVDNKGCIKLADFGASKQVAKLATITAAKSMKGTPYWMAPEVIVQSGHSFSADIWSVGCTIIEMATGKPPWSQQYQEVAALFHVGTTKSHPPIPEHLSLEAKDFLLKCLQEEPNLRPGAFDLLQHPFVTGEFKDPHPLYHSPVKEPSKTVVTSSKVQMNNLGLNDMKHAYGSGFTINSEKASTVRPIWEVSPDDEVCRFSDTDDFPVVGSSFNPMSEPFDDWPCKFDFSAEQRIMNSDDLGMPTNGASGGGQEGENDFTFPCGQVCEDDEVTETKIKAFLDEKALDLKKLQTPLYEEFYNTMNATSSHGVESTCKETITNISRLPPKGKSSPNKVVSGSSSPCSDTTKNISPGNRSRQVSSTDEENNQILREIPSPQLNEWGDPLQDVQQEPTSLSTSFSERRRKWKEELDQELEREREMMRQAGLVGKISPKDRGLNRKKDHLPSTSPAK